MKRFLIFISLNPKIWQDDKLRNDVKLKLLDIVEQFVSTCDVPLHIIDVHLVGSMASYNYTEYSDLDVHIVCNFELVDCSKEILQTAYNSVKAKFNSDYNITIKGIDVEIYVEDVRSSVTSNGIYSLYQDNWIKFPKKLTDVPGFTTGKTTGEGIVLENQEITRVVNEKNAVDEGGREE